MCITVTKAYKADRDIDCFKVVGVKELDGEKYRITPIMAYHIGDDIIQGNREFTARIPFGTSFYVERGEDGMRMFEHQEGTTEADMAVHNAGYGFIHCYKKYQDIAHDWKFWRDTIESTCEVEQGDNIERHIEIYHCIIPKGTLCCEGWFGDIITIGAQTIVFREKLNYIFPASV